MGAAALAIVGVIAAGALSSGARDDEAITASGTEALTGRDAMSLQCTPRALSENGAPNDVCTAAADRDRLFQDAPTSPRIDAVDDGDPDSPEHAPVGPSTPDGRTPATPAPAVPPAAPPVPGEPNAPAEPAPSAPSPTAPIAPAPVAPAPPAPAPAALPLGFNGISENHVIGLLGIKLLSSYTLSLSGQPGATASVSYGSRDAGTVTFDAGGRASITLGGTLLSAGLSNPTIRVAYSDGTSGSAIQAPRDSI